METVKHKVGVKGSMMAPQSKFNEFVKYNQNEQVHHIPGYLGFVPSIRAENLHGRTFGVNTAIVEINKQIHHGDLCPERDPSVSDLQAYLDIRKDKEKLRAQYLDKNGLNYGKREHFERNGYQQGEITLNVDDIYQNIPLGHEKEFETTQNPTDDHQLTLKSTLIRTRPTFNYEHALLYKNWVLTKRSKAAFCCQLFTPMFGIMLLALILSNKDNFASSTVGLFDSDVVPSSIYFSNMITPRWEDLYGDLISIENPIRIKRFAPANQAIETLFRSWIRTQSNTLSFTGTADDGSTVIYPKWEKFEALTIDEMNLQLIKDIKYLNTLDKTELSSDEVLPDTSLLIQELSMENGIKAHLQINNIAYFQYHRSNGDTLGSLGGGDGASNAVVFSTESAIGVMNLVSNMHFQNIFQNDFVNVISMVSQTLDSNNIEELIQSILALVCNNLFPVSLSLGFPVMLFLLTMEKEEKIKSLLEINGLNIKSYWQSFFVYNFIILELTVVIWLIIGKIWIDIDFFQVASLFITFWFLSIWNLSQIGFSLFVSTFMKTSRTSTLVGYQGSIFLMIFLSIVSQFLFPNPGTVPWFFYIFPQTGVARFIYLSISKCIDYKCYENFSDIREEMLTVFIAQHLSFVVYTTAGLILNEPYLQRVVSKWILKRWIKKKELETRKSIASRLSGRKTVSNQSEQLMDNEVGGMASIRLIEEKHISARLYEDAVKKTDYKNPQYELIAKNISKTFECSQGYKKALKNFSLKIEKGKIFGLLGPNGAGKTTFLGIITGMMNSDTGGGVICGHSIDDIGSHTGEIGFCPQFDILWPQLNVEEHLIFMSMFKGQTIKESMPGIKELIKDVDLEDDYKKMACQLSGGMKRRCSLAMSLSGNPRIIFLDEPSSGLDPVKRRHFWQLIKKVTGDKAVLLTTHLMEEADTLCNEIGIITTGQLRCIGNSLALKNSFIEGIKLQVVMNTENRSDEAVENFIRIIKEKLKDVKVETNFRGTLGLVIGANTINKESIADKKELANDQMNLQTDDLEAEKSILESNVSRSVEGAANFKLSILFEQITTLAEEYLSDWSLTLGSLEDVFLAVVRRYRETNISENYQLRS